MFINYWIIVNAQAGLFFGLTRAFDCLNISFIKYKFFNIGFRGKFLEWIVHFLPDRTMLLLEFMSKYRCTSGIGVGTSNFFMYTLSPGFSLLWVLIYIKIQNSNFKFFFPKKSQVFGRFLYFNGYKTFTFVCDCLYSFTRESHATGFPFKNHFTEEKLLFLFKWKLNIFFFVLFRNRR